MNDSILESLQRISELKQDFYFDFPIDNCELGNWTWTFTVSHYLSVIFFAIAFENHRGNNFKTDGSFVWKSTYDFKLKYGPIS